MIKYSKWKINSEFNQTDVVLVLGANDVVNPAAKTPEVLFLNANIRVFKAQSVIVNKRSMHQDTQD